MGATITVAVNRINPLLLDLIKAGLREMLNQAHMINVLILGLVGAWGGKAIVRS